MAMDIAEIERLIKEGIPDATVQIRICAEMAIITRPL